MDNELIVQPPSRELERAKLSLRADICKDCPHRTKTPSFELDDQPDCERECEVFTHLPELVDAANRVEPMVGSFEQVMNQSITNICEHTTPPPSARGKRRKLQRYRHAITRTLAKVFGY